MLGERRPVASGVDGPGADHVGSGGEAGGHIGGGLLGAEAHVEGHARGVVGAEVHFDGKHVVTRDQIAGGDGDGLPGLDISGEGDVRGGDGGMADGTRRHIQATDFRAIEINDAAILPHDLKRGTEYQGGVGDVDLGAEVGGDGLLNASSAGVGIRSGHGGFVETAGHTHAVPKGADAAFGPDRIVKGGFFPSGPLIGSIVEEFPNGSAGSGIDGVVDDCPGRGSGTYPTQGEGHRSGIPRVSAIDRKPNGAYTGVGHGHGGIFRKWTAQRVEHGRVEGRRGVKGVGAQLGDDGVVAGGEIVEEHGFGTAPVIGRPGGALGITPARGLGNHGRFQFGSELIEAGLVGGQGKGSVGIDQMLVDAVCKLELVFLAGGEILMKELGIVDIGGAPWGKVVGSERAGAVGGPRIKGILAVVCDKNESGAPTAVAQGEMIVGRTIGLQAGEWSILVAAEKRKDHVIDQIILVEQHRIRRGSDAVRGPTDQLEVLGIFFSRSVGRGVDGPVGVEIPAVAIGGARLGAEALPSGEVPGGGGRSEGGAFGLDDIIVRWRATLVAGGKGGLGAFLHGIDTPINSVEIKVDVAIALCGLPHVLLHVAADLVAQEGIGCPIGRGPGEILGAGEVELREIGGCRGIAREDRIGQFWSAIFVPEINAEAVLGVGSRQSVASANGGTAGHLEIVAHAGGVVDHFHAGGAFPIRAGLICMGVNARVGIGQEGNRHGETDAGKRFQGTLRLGGASDVGVGVVDNVGIHGVIQQLATQPDTRSRPSREAGWLADDVRRENVRMGDGLAGYEARLDCDDPHHGGLGNIQGRQAGIGWAGGGDLGAVGGSGHGSVCGVINGAARGGRGKVGGEGSAENAPFNACHHRSHKADAGRCGVGSSGCGEFEVRLNYGLGQSCAV